MLLNLSDKNLLSDDVIKTPACVILVCFFYIFNDTM